MESTACLDGQEIVPLVQRLSTDLQKLEVEDAPALASRNANLDGLLTKLLNWTPSAPNHSDDDEDAEHDSTIWIGHGQLDWVFPHITSALASWNDCSQGRDLAAIINALFAAVVSAEAVLRARGVDRSIVPSHLLLKLQAVLDDALALTREQLQQAKSTSSGLGGAARLEPMVGGAGAAEPAAGTESNLEKAATTVGKEDATAAADKGAAGTGVGAGGAVPSGVKRGAEKQVAGVAGPVAAEVSWRLRDSSPHPHRRS